MSNSRTLFLNIKEVEETGEFFFSFQFMEDQQWIKPSFFFHLGAMLQKKAEQGELLWLLMSHISLTDSPSGTSVDEIQLSEENLLERCEWTIEVMDKYAHDLILKDIHKKLNEDRKRIHEANKKTLESIGLSYDSEFFEELLEGCELDGEIEIVSEPNGEKQHGEHNDFFSEVYVDQSSNGEDSFWGYIYAKFAEDQWLKIGYSC